MAKNFAEFVAEEVRKDTHLYGEMIQAVHEDEIPVFDVDVYIENAAIKVTHWDAGTKVATAEINAKWDARLAADSDGEMTESGTIVTTARYRHKGQGLDLVEDTHVVRYDHFDE